MTRPSATQKTTFDPRLNLEEDTARPGFCDADGMCTDIYLKDSEGEESSGNKGDFCDADGLCKNQSSKTAEKSSPGPEHPRRNAVLNTNKSSMNTTQGSVLLSSDDTEGLHTVIPTRRTGKIVVGFASRFFFNHSVGRLMEGVICTLDRRLFQVVVFPLQRRKIDGIGRSIRECADEVRMLLNFSLRLIGHLFLLGC
jgi:hypothetical protein